MLSDRQRCRIHHVPSNDMNFEVTEGMIRAYDSSEEGMKCAHVSPRYRSAIPNMASRTALSISLRFAEAQSQPDGGCDSDPALLMD